MRLAGLCKLECVRLVLYRVFGNAPPTCNLSAITYLICGLIPHLWMGTTKGFGLSQIFFSGIFSKVRRSVSSAGDPQSVDNVDWLDQMDLRDFSEIDSILNNKQPFSNQPHSQLKSRPPAAASSKPDVKRKYETVIDANRPEDRRKDTTNPQGNMSWRLGDGSIPGLFTYSRVQGSGL